MFEVFSGQKRKAAAEHGPLVKRKPMFDVLDDETFEPQNDDDVIWELDENEIEFANKVCHELPENETDFAADAFDFDDDLFEEFADDDDDQPPQQVQQQEELHELQPPQPTQAAPETVVGGAADERAFVLAQPLQSLRPQQQVQQVQQRAQAPQYGQRVYMVQPYQHPQYQHVVLQYPQQYQHLPYHHHQLHPHQQMYRHWEPQQQHYYVVPNQGHYVQLKPVPHHANLPQYSPCTAPIPTRPTMVLPVPVEEKKSRTMVNIARTKKTWAKEAESPRDDDEFATVNSHIVITGRNKNSVTVGEIRRRIGAPEYLDSKEIAQLIRHSQFNIAAFEKKFVLSGFDLTGNNTTRPRLTISSLMEGDAQKLYSNFNNLLAYLAKEVLSAIAISGAGEGIAEHAEWSIRYLSYVRKYWQCNGHYPKDLKKEENCSPDEAAVRIFSLATHGFGPLAAVSVINVLMIAMSRIRQSGTARVPAAAAVQMNASEDIDWSHLSNNTDDFDIFEKSVLPRIGYTNPIEVSVGEMRRRVYGPEKMNTSLMIAFLRKTKTNNTPNDLKERLYGITPSKKAMKGLNSSCWGCITEQESMAMARETGAALSRLPSNQELKDRAAANPEAASCLRLVVEALATAMERVGERPEQIRAQTDIDRHILRFAMLTHHFGHSFFAAVMKWIQQSLN